MHALRDVRAPAEEALRRAGGVGMRLPGGEREELGRVREEIRELESRLREEHGRAQRRTQDELREERQMREDLERRMREEGRMREEQLERRLREEMRALRNVLVHQGSAAAVRSVIDVCHIHMIHHVVFDILSYHTRYDHNKRRPLNFAEVDRVLGQIVRDRWGEPCPSGWSNGMRQLYGELKDLPRPALDEVLNRMRDVLTMLEGSFGNPHFDDVVDKIKTEAEEEWQRMRQSRWRSYHYRTERGWPRGRPLEQSFQDLDRRTQAVKSGFSNRLHDLEKQILLLGSLAEEEHALDVVVPKLYVTLLHYNRYGGLPRFTDADLLALRRINLRCYHKRLVEHAEVVYRDVEYDLGLSSARFRVLHDRRDDDLSQRSTKRLKP